MFNTNGLTTCAGLSGYAGGEVDWTALSRDPGGYLSARWQYIANDPPMSMDRWEIVALYRQLLRAQDKGDAFAFLMLPGEDVPGTPFTPRVASTSRTVMVVPRTPSRTPSGRAPHLARTPSWVGQRRDVEVEMAAALAVASSTPSRATSSGPSHVRYGGFAGILPSLSPVEEEGRGERPSPPGIRLPLAEVLPSLLPVGVEEGLMDLETILSLQLPAGESRGDAELGESALPQAEEAGVDAKRRESPLSLEMEIPRASEPLAAEEPGGTVVGEARDEHHPSIPVVPVVHETSSPEGDKDGEERGTPCAAQSPESNKRPRRKRKPSVSPEKGPATRSRTVSQSKKYVFICMSVVHLLMTMTGAKLQHPEEDGNE